MRKSFLSLSLAFAVVATLLVPGVATAAPVREYQLQYSPAGDGTRGLMIVVAMVDPDASLPTSITVPVPAGSELLWAGELLGGDAAADPARETTVERLGTMDIYSLTVTQSYVAQLEIALPAAKTTAKRFEASVAWTNPGDAVLVTSSLVAEPGATNVRVKPAVAGQAVTNAAGETLYPLEPAQLAAGDTLKIDVTWDRSRVATSARPASPIPWLIGGVVLAALLLAAALMMERTRTRRAALARARREGRGLTDE